MTYEQHCQQILSIMKEKYCLDKNDYWSEESVQQSYDAGETPQDWCDWIAQKYDLTSLDEHNLKFNKENG